MTEKTDMQVSNTAEAEHIIVESQGISPFRKRVRLRMMRLISEATVSIDVLAQDLALSSRTLQRRLANEGTSYQHEANQLREDMARYYLTHTQYTGTQIARLLGYHDTNSFFRAFHGWTGQTPRSVRHRGSSAS